MSTKREPIAIAVGWTVRRQLRDHGVSHGRTALELGLSVDTLRKSLDGRRPFLVDELAVIAEEVGVSVSDIICQAETARATA